MSNEAQPVPPPATAAPESTENPLIPESDLETLKYAASAAGTSNTNLRAIAGGVLRLMTCLKFTALVVGEFGELRTRITNIEKALGIGEDPKPEAKKPRRGDGEQKPAQAT